MTVLFLIKGRLFTVVMLAGWLDIHVQDLFVEPTFSLAIYLDRGMIILANVSIPRTNQDCHYHILE